MTDTVPESPDLARLEALARAAEAAETKFDGVRLTPEHDAWMAAYGAREDANDELSEALSPSVVLALLAQVRAGEAAIRSLRSLSNTTEDIA